MLDQLQDLRASMLSRNGVSALFILLLEADMGGNRDNKEHTGYTDDDGDDYEGARCHLFINLAYGRVCLCAAVAIATVLT